MFFKRCLSASAACGLAALSATAEPCSATAFSPAAGELYLTAETALLHEDDAARALELTDKLWASNLNCYERGGVRKLRAATLVELGQHERAADLLVPLVSDLDLPASERARQAYNIGQLYKAAGNEEAGEPYLQMSEDLKTPTSE